MQHKERSAVIGSAVFCEDYELEYIVSLKLKSFKLLEPLA